MMSKCILIHLPRSWILLPVGTCVVELLDHDYLIIAHMKSFMQEILRSTLLIGSSKNIGELHTWKQKGNREESTIMLKVLVGKTISPTMLLVTLIVLPVG